MVGCVIELDVTPVGKPRMTQRDKWAKRPCVSRYWEFCDKVRLEAKKHDYVLGGFLAVTFIIPMPESWSEKKKKAMDDKPHQQRPDIDNLSKAFMDAMAKEDSHVWSLNARKRWGRVAKIILH